MRRTEIPAVVAVALAQPQPRPVRVVLADLLGECPHHAPLLLIGQVTDLLVQLGDLVGQARRQLLGR